MSVVRGSKLSKGSTECLFIFSSRPENTKDPKFGFESPQRYKSIVRHSYNLEPLAISEAFLAMWRVCLKDLTRDEFDEKYTEKLSKTEWLTQVHDILQAAFKVSAVITSGIGNVLIHCHSGINCTPVLSSLAQVICCEHYRTIKGFGVLV
jgi:hypothetical protein